MIKYLNHNKKLLINLMIFIIVYTLSCCFSTTFNAAIAAEVDELSDNSLPQSGSSLDEIKKIQNTTNHSKIY